MTSAAPRRRPSPRALLLVLAVAVVLAGLVLALDLRRAENALSAARGTAPSLAQALRDGDQARAQALLTSVGDRTRTAREATDGPLWAAAVHLPWAGRTLRATQAVSRTADRVVTGVGDPMVDALRQLRAAHEGVHGRVDLEAVEKLRPALVTAASRAQQEQRALAQAPRAWVLPRVGRAREELLGRLGEVSSALEGLAEGTGVLPGLLGGQGTRTYLLAFQNNAEARGTGGLLGGFGLLRVDHGRPTVLHVGSDRELDRLPAPRLDLGADFAHLYGQDLSAWQNANLSGHFPSVARLWLDIWQRFTGQRLDGVIATDPTALARLLAVTGPVAVPGGPPVTAADVVERTESQVYAQFGDDDVRRKGYLVTVGQRVLDHLLGPKAPGLTDLARPLLDSAHRRSVMAYSTRPAEERWLTGTPLGGDVPDVPGPFALLTVNNTAGNKIDYYLERAVTYELASCRDGRRATTLTARLRVDVPTTPLPHVVVGRLDHRDRPPRSTSLLVSWYVARGAQVLGAEVDGRPARVFVGREQGHPVVAVRLELLARQPRVVSLRLSEPASTLRPLVLEQSLARPQETVVRDARCG